MGKIIDLGSREKTFMIKNGHDDSKKHYSEGVPIAVIIDEYQNIEVFHLINNFVYIYWNKNMSNTKNRRMRTLTNFFNYIIKNKKELNIKVFEDISFDTYNSFKINKNKKGIKKSTIKYHENTIIEFFYYIIFDLKIIMKSIHENDFIFYNKNDKKKISNQKFTYLRHYFIRKGLIIQRRIEEKQKNTINNIDKDLIRELFVCAELLDEKQMILGMLMQINGGLRVGEGVNLTLKSINYSNSIMPILDVKKNKRLYGDGKSETKKGRKQIVFMTKDKLEEVVKEHMAFLESKGYGDSSKSLFYCRNNKPMNAANYRYHFNKVRDLFIKRLFERGDPRATHYRESDWSTHIGRGIFSNLVLESVKENPILLQLYRGDSNLSSAISYISENPMSFERISKYMGKLF